eukprot:6560902-Lingulodinium_polyedra.AAC.1
MMGEVRAEAFPALEAAAVAEAAFSPRPRPIAPNRPNGVQPEMVGPWAFGAEFGPVIEQFRVEVGQQAEGR